MCSKGCDAATKEQVVVLRWGGGRNKEGKSHRSVKEVSSEINVEGQEGAYFLVAQRHGGCATL